ncbi:ATP-dependent Clp protease adaptor ClpS [Tenacibaculum aestuariivivum]|uniref:ATP-dependent Clp protease adaptor ClpS n=1 Tax=Tenacibaculum aestuariivivum TaxID=2006131 RepID=UPI003AB3EBEA
MSTIEKIQEELDVLIQETKKHEIILHNDDVNTFDFVIDSLVDVCDHTLEQAEQCSVLVHYKGKCAVKTGDYKDLEPRCSKLQQLGLSAEII